MAESSYTDPKVIEMSRNFVNFVAHQETTHGDREITVGKEKRKVCSEYYTIPCDVHVAGWKAIDKFFKGNFGTPTTVFCDPTGKELSRKPGGLGSSELIKEMQATIGKVSGEHMPFSVWSQAKKGMADGDAAFEKKEFAKAIDAYSKVAKLKGKGFKEMGDEGLKKAADAGEGALKEALALDDVEAKKKALKKIADDFKPLEVSAKARKELDALK